MVAPGGLDIAINGNRGVWHGYVRALQDPTEVVLTVSNSSNYGSGRAMYAGGLSLQNNTITAVIGGP